MLKQIIDLHIHSKYSRACSGDLELPKIAMACVKKGIDIVATGDFTHPGWLKHIKENLEEIGESGLFKLKVSAIDGKPLCVPPWKGGKAISPSCQEGAGGVAEAGTKFILSTEISCIYKDKDKTRRLHLVILAPNIESVEKFNAELEKKGVNLKSDGRPIMGLKAVEVLKIMLDIDERFMMIPAHAWTPWFSVFGSKSGYDSLEECFGELTPHIKAIETGLSSDPTMNHRLSMLDKITLVSNSDAHSLEKLGREANVFSFTDDADINYDEITQIIKMGDRKKFLYTIEFFPEEGKYHFDGHADCGACLSPVETKKNKNICPKCKKNLVVGVLNRVDELSDRAEKNIDQEKFIPHRYVVPLKEIIAKVFGVGVSSKKVNKEYEELIKKLGNEFEILLSMSEEKIMEVVSDKNIAVAIKNMRAGRVKVHPGYDGKFGVVEPVFIDNKAKNKQSRLF